ncbi:MAG: hypothetical protein ACD_30C00052G0022 [uncultured bacterium]|uniref:Uncharacterized protein n=3 Tax=Candidatus Daviesiibacteriota TaxID=1752718 RepID=A0A0G0F6S6_9BACT|nr:MAG: hypothetical protein ACD_30C00052G0022 [uncultured bacterium]KKQ09205.1 MAG: hypothetical protein US19_C0016G0028 [Candidatus Daviesbacteria bacterium GW2011_GWB1_36_5]KKQ14803.1 MAG: hypothetical protein US28_C0029G0028 [Candidatus Daviesbacteria bacterium GW2011_GWA1_36_8]OGE35314.1 MAG: hypothetical protein A3E66_00455 [Candidatus Daviesbacteria bacterium RIFCSPHIGHO2_12_FULL_37_16]
MALNSQVNRFFNWYNRHLTLNISIAAVLFTLQLIHLYWLFTDVILFKLIGRSFFHLTGVWYTLILIVDYTEIPALISTGLIYVNELRKKGYSFKNVLFIILLASQFLHIFWITDEYVIEQFAHVSNAPILPHWLAWIAILIDYGEVPVIIDTLKKVFDALKKGDINKVKESF